MTQSTYFVAIPFFRRWEGLLVPGIAMHCSSAEHAREEASRLASNAAGTVAFSRSIDLDSGEAKKGHILSSDGDLPNLEYLLE